jgi:hypothetical protein
MKPLTERYQADLLGVLSCLQFIGIYTTQRLRNSAKL